MIDPLSAAGLFATLIAAKVGATQEDLERVQKLVSLNKQDLSLLVQKLKEQPQELDQALEKLFNLLSAGMAYTHKHLDELKEEMPKQTAAVESSLQMLTALQAKVEALANASRRRAELVVEWASYGNVVRLARELALDFPVWVSSIEGDAADVEMWIQQSGSAMSTRTKVAAVRNVDQPRKETFKCSVKEPVTAPVTLVAEYRATEQARYRMTWKLTFTANDDFGKLQKESGPDRIG